MKKITTFQITEAVCQLCLKAAYRLPPDVKKALENGYNMEVSATGRYVLTQLLENAEIASTDNIALCQDTGMAVVFVEVGQEVHIEGGSLTDAINEGVRRGYKMGYLRNSIFGDPLLRVNTGDNTPAVIHYDFVEGDKLKLVLAPKGFGSENMSAVSMLKPSDGIEGVKRFILGVVEKAGSNPCPPIFVGVGIGGTMEKAAFLAKKALLRPLGTGSIHQHIKMLEEKLLLSINCLGIGPAGLGGKVTALGVSIEIFPTHIAGLPVAVNICCHSLRHAEVVI
ncbi:MAG: fumarate hydratase [Clostridiales bacterium]|nr:fumarate hydratase [Clostridiales bacterium]